MNFKDMASIHKRRWGVNGCSDKSTDVEEGIEGFNSVIDNMEAPTVHEVYFTEPYKYDLDKRIVGKILISDMTRSDSDTLDQKLFHCKLDEKIGCGSYVWWNKEIWLIGNEDNNAFQTHKTYVAKRCRTSINYGYKGVVYNFPTIITNLTLYSDGLGESVHLTLAEAKRSLLVSKNDITKNIGIETRIMINNSVVFKVTHIDDFTNENIYILTLLEEVFNAKDDIENNIAWNEIGEIEYVENPIYNITGNEEIFLGDNDVYTFIRPINRWIVKSKDNNASVVKIDDYSCRVICGTENKYINTEIELIAIDRYEEELASKFIMIRGIF